MIRIFDNYYLFQTGDLKMFCSWFLQHENTIGMNNFIVGPNDIAYCNYVTYLSFLTQNDVFYDVVNSREDFERKNNEGLIINDQRAWAGYFDESNEAINLSAHIPPNYVNYLKGSSTTLKIWLCHDNAIDKYHNINLNKTVNL
jgi:hypothetical protein